MKRTARTLAGLSTAALLAVGCGAVTGASSLKSDNAHAKKAFKNATSVSVTLHVVDPDGSLRKAALKHDSGPGTAMQVDAFTAGSVNLVFSATGGRTILDAGAPDQTTADALKHANVALTVNGLGGRLVDIRVVDGVLYVASDIEAVKRAAALGDPEGPSSIDDFFANAPDEIKPGADDVKAGKYLKLALPSYVERFEKRAKELKLPGYTSSTAHKDYSKLLRELRHAITPHITLRDLGESGSTRHVAVDVAVKKALVDALAILRANASTLGIAADLLPATSDLEKVSNTSLSANLRIKNGHYTQLSIPFASFLALDATPDPDAPQLGKSSLVIDLDDSAPPVTVPTNVSTFNVDKQIDTLLEGFTGGGADSESGSTNG